MTFDKARATRCTYLATSVLVGGVGILILVVSLLKGLYIGADQQGGFVTPTIRPIIGWIFANCVLVSCLWPWMSETGFVEPSSMALSPTTLLGVALCMIAVAFLMNGIRLGRWMVEVRELVAEEEMAASRRPPSHRQSTGNVKAGRDANISQQITNHYNHRPDNPKAPIIVALIGAAAVIAAALLRSS